MNTIIRIVLLSSGIILAAIGVDENCIAYLIVGGICIGIYVPSGGNGE